MAAPLTHTDLAPFCPGLTEAKAAAMIDDVWATAQLEAPCITSTDFTADPLKMAALKAILRQSLIRWNDAGSGAVGQTTAGPFSQTISTPARVAAFTDREKADLRRLCTGTSPGSPFTISTIPGSQP